MPFHPVAAAKDAFFDEIKSNLRDVVTGKDRTLDRLVRLSMQANSIARLDIKSLAETLVNVREVKQDIEKSEDRASDENKHIVKRLELLERVLADQTRKLSTRLDTVASILENRQEAPRSERLIQARESVRVTHTRDGREQLRDAKSGRYVRQDRQQEERAAGDSDILRKILSYQKKIYEQGKEAHVDWKKTFGSRPGQASTAGYGYGGGRGPGGSRTSNAPPHTPEQKSLLGGLWDSAKEYAGDALAGAVGAGKGGLARGLSRVLPFVRGSIGPAATIGLGIHAINRIQADKDKLVQPGSVHDLESLTNFIDPRLHNVLYGRGNQPTAAANPAAARGPNANLLPNLPVPIIRPRDINQEARAHVTTPEDAEALKKMLELQKQLQEELDEIKRKSPRRNFRNYRADEIQQQLQGLNAQIDTYQQGGTVGGYGAGGGGMQARANRGRAQSEQNISGVTPGVGQTSTQAQADARQQREQAQMPTYNPQMSPSTAAGAGPMQIPGAPATTPSGVTDIPVTFGGGGPQTTKNALTGRGQGVQTTSTGFFYPGKDVMGGQATAGAQGEPDYTRLGQAQKGSAEYQAYAYQFLKSRGYSNDAAAIIMGQTNTESKFDPRSLNPNDAPKNRGMTYDIGNGQTYSAADSIGLQQRNGGRAIGMIKNGEAIFGKKWSDMSNQERMYADLDYTDKELKGTDTTNPSGAGQYKKTGDILNGPGSIADKAGTFGHRFEGYAGPTQAGRTNDAIAFAQKGASGGYNQDFSRGSGGPPITASIPGMPGMPSMGMGTIDQATVGAKNGDAKNAQFATINPSSVAGGSGPAGAERFSVTGSAARAGVEKVDPALVAAARNASQYLPEGYRVEMNSGLREGDPRFHGKGMAADFTIYDDKGRKLDNYQTPENFRTYEKFAQDARASMMQNNPDVADKLRWGGYFGGKMGPGGKYGANDIMHLDMGGRQVGMAAGSWEEGLNKDYRGVFDSPNNPSRGMGKNYVLGTPTAGGVASAALPSGMIQPQSPTIPGAVPMGQMPSPITPSQVSATGLSGSVKPGDDPSKMQAIPVAIAAVGDKALGVNTPPEAATMLGFDQSGGTNASTIGAPEATRTQSAGRSVTAREASVEPSKSTDDWLNEGLSSTANDAVRDKIKAADADAKSWAGDFDKRFNAKASGASASAAAMPDTPRAKTPDPSPPVKSSPAVSASDEDSDSGSGGKKGSSKGSDDDDGDDDSDSKSGGKMDAIEHSINDFGMKSLNTPSYA